ncbi:DNA-binding protein [Streptomyces viridochromogenes DSM 40736]|uniref:DNA-binding protein n=1 Tax=Streptomyces viridochromogenes (strain DSM 40736 / JCM 4977 / BCRC 1201 / Tue 494) TaxID=591159 RepID=D9X9L7_STRVT|nr:DNA-binding protein [Streptomyces viridochromogenes DSM 40736]
MLVTLQVMPTNTEAHPGLDGRVELLKFPDGTAVGRSDGAFNGRPTPDPKQLRILELRYGTIRAQAFPPAPPHDPRPRLQTHRRPPPRPGPEGLDHVPLLRGQE